jgi:hypothetical protein
MSTAVLDISRRICANATSPNSIQKSRQLTPAFWDIANANRATEETDLQDVLDFMGRPAAVTIEQVLTCPKTSFELGEWLRDRKNRRVVPKHFRECGYAVVHNPDRKDGQWVINGNSRTIYARKDLSLRDQLNAARQLTTSS